MMGHHPLKQSCVLREGSGITLAHQLMSARAS